MNFDVLQGAGIALLSLGGGVGLQYLVGRKTDERDRRAGFQRDTLLALQSALGDMAMAVERLRAAQHGAASWAEARAQVPWLDLVEPSVRFRQDRVALDDTELRELASAAEAAFRRAISAASADEFAADYTPTEGLFDLTTARIGELIRQL